MKIYLDVPYSDKDLAKQKGARWDSERKKWFVPDQVDASHFRQWLPTERDMPMILLGPIYLLSSTESCWSCHRDTDVFCVAGNSVVDLEDEDDIPDEDLGDSDSLVRVIDLDAIAPEIENFLQKYTPRYRMDFSRTQNARVRMNHCEHCNAKLGDFYLHNEPGGAFFPMTDEEADRITREVIADAGRFGFSGGYSISG